VPREENALYTPNVALQSLSFLGKVTLLACTFYDGLEAECTGHKNNQSPPNTNPILLVYNVYYTSLKVVFDIYHMITGLFGLL
jgi:hypothetical protein